MHTSHGHSSKAFRTPHRQGKSSRSARRVLIALLLLVVALPGVRPTRAYASATGLAGLPPAWLDDRGQPFDLRTLQGHAVVLTMAYATCHRVCPMTMRRLEQMQRDFDRRGTRAEFLVIGYDPDRDDAAAWHQYRATRHLTRSNWHFLVGTRAAVEQTARQLGFEFWKYDEHVMHDTRVLYFDERGTLLETREAAGYETTLR
jgi:cytochrome oxidase Cu insertion factor (SCO1/SenC/PrrC family)